MPLANMWAFVAGGQKPKWPPFWKQLFIEYSIVSLIMLHILVGLCIFLDEEFIFDVVLKF